MGKDDVALGIYAYGLKNVSSENEDVKVSSTTSVELSVTDTES